MALWQLRRLGAEQGPPALGELIDGHQRNDTIDVLATQIVQAFNQH